MVQQITGGCSQACHAKQSAGEWNAGHLSPTIPADIGNGKIMSLWYPQVLIQEGALSGSQQPQIWGMLVHGLQNSEQYLLVWKILS